MCLVQKSFQMIPTPGPLVPEAWIPDPTCSQAPPRPGPTASHIAALGDLGAEESQLRARQESQDLSSHRKLPKGKGMMDGGVEGTAPLASGLVGQSDELAAS